MFNDLLIDDYINELWKQGVQDQYVWNYENENLDMEDLINKQLLSILRLETLSQLDINYCYTNQIINELSPNFWRVIKLKEREYFMIKSFISGIVPFNISNSDLELINSSINGRRPSIYF